MIQTNDLTEILDNNEKVIWQDKPQFIPFVLSGLPLLIFGIIWAIMDRPLIYSVSHNLQELPFLLMHLLPLWLGLAHCVYLFLSFKNTQYAVTNKRVIIRTGFWGINFQSIDFDKITDLRVNVNFFQNLFNVGTIVMNNGIYTNNNNISNGYKLAELNDPYKAYKLIKSTEVDVKTDWDYPNQLRPSENPGYNTQYRPDATS